MTFANSQGLVTLSAFLFSWQTPQWETKPDEWGMSAQDTDRWERWRLSGGTQSESFGERRLRGRLPAAGAARRRWLRLCSSRWSQRKAAPSRCSASPAHTQPERQTHTQLTDLHHVIWIITLNGLCSDLSLNSGLNSPAEKKMIQVSLVDVGGANETPFYQTGGCLTIQISSKDWRCSYKSNRITLNGINSVTAAAVSTADCKHNTDISWCDKVDAAEVLTNTTFSFHLKSCFWTFWPPWTSWSQGNRLAL